MAFFSSFLAFFSSFLAFFSSFLAFFFAFFVACPPLAWAPAGLGSQMAKVPPVGSAATANHPMPGTSVRSMNTVPPSALIFATLASTDSTPT